MSGGVDSTATALMLVEDHEIEGFFMKLAQPDLEKQEARVKDIATKLGIELHIIDLRKQFSQEVLDYFSESYFSGLTPNPCVICNREIKFGLFLRTILDHGMDMMATGHYAQLRQSESGVHLHMGTDPRKDQTYFLSRLTQEQLTRILFPLGQQRKEQTYQYVENAGFTDFRGLESQDVCFLSDTSVGNYLDNLTSATNKQGPIVDCDGKVLGHHRGLCHYTIGQRKGLGISSSQPLYVIGLSPETNSVLVGPDKELFKSTLIADDFHWLSGTAPDTGSLYTIRIRYTHRGGSGKLELNEDGTGKIHFDEPQRAITPGQFAVIYKDDELLGSSIITGGC